MADEEPPPHLMKAGLAPLSSTDFPSLNRTYKKLQVLPTRSVSSPPSYVEAVKSIGHGIEHTSPELYMSTPEPAATLADPEVLPPISEHQGKPAVFFPLSRREILVDKLKYVLIGKFSHGRPKWDSIKKFFTDLKLKGAYNISVFDFKHIIIECSCKEDFDRLWLKLAWSIDGFSMRVFLWSPDFHPSKESSIAPVWISMVGLPLHLLDEMSISQISQIVGKPIKVDARNVRRSMLNQARVCVQLDVVKPLLKTFWVGFINEATGEIVESHCVNVFYDVLPAYCSCCAHIGHNNVECKRKSTETVLSAEVGKDKPALLENSAAKRPGKEHVIWQPVDKNRQVDAPMVLASTSAQIPVVSERQHKQTSHSNQQQLQEISMTKEKTIVNDSKAAQTSTQNQFTILSATEDAGFETQDNLHKKMSYQDGQKDGNDEQDGQLSVNYNTKMTGGKAPQVVDVYQGLNLNVFEDKQTKLAEVNRAKIAEYKTTAEISPGTLLQQDNIDAYPNSADTKDIALAEESVLVELHIDSDAERTNQKSKDQTTQKDCYTDGKKITEDISTPSDVNCTKSELGDALVLYVSPLGKQPEIKSNNEAEADSGQVCVQEPNSVINIEAISYSSSIGAIVVREGATTETNVVDTIDGENQGWQVVKRNSKTKGVVTRSQAKNSSNSWADMVEIEDNDKTPEQKALPNSKVKASNTSKRSKKHLERQMCKLGHRLNMMSDGHKMRPQLQAEMDALQEEFSLLR